MSEKKFYISKSERILFPKIPILCYCGCNTIVWNGNNYIKGHNNRVYSYIKGKHRSEESKKKQSIANIKTFLIDDFGNKLIYPFIPTLCPCGCNEIIWDPRTTIKQGHISRINPPINNLKLGWELNQTEDHKNNLSEKRKELIKIRPDIIKRGKEHYKWNGGKKLREARANYKRLERGFILLTNSNPYNEPIDYHHPDFSKPYVVPCPTRIHEMFTGRKDHHKLVNFWLGIVRIGD